MRPCLIAIAGPSGSGKSLFAQTLCEEMRRDAPQLGVALLREDAYYRDQKHLPLEERALVNYDHPDAIEQDLLLEHLETLRAGQGVDTPLYDYAQHTRRPDTQRVEAAPVIVVEGILLFTHVALRECFDIRFFMDTPLDVCLLRRIERDVAERGRTLASVLEQYQRTVRPMYEAFIAPSAAHADLLIRRGGQNRVALDFVRGHLIGLQHAEPASPPAA
ncbi:MAG: uridine kinase [Halieaceae bacterium]|nr:uridine kinase [Halieaceae bacterium]